MRNATTLLTLFSLLTLLPQVSCRPSQTIHMKERVKETEKWIVAPKQSSKVDHFIAGKAHGDVGFLWIVDNSESVRDELTIFKTQYEAFIEAMPGPSNPTSTTPQRPDAALLRYRSQVVTTPQPVVPANFASEEDYAGHMAELFGPSPILNGELLYTKPTPYASALAAFQSKAFLGQPQRPLFIIFLLGDEPEKENNTSTYIEQFGKLAGYHRLFLFIIHNKNRVLTGTRTKAAADFINELRSKFPIPEKDKRIREFDILSPDFENLTNTLIYEVVAFKNKYILSEVPFQPQGMTFQIADSRTLGYGTDFTFDPLTNEVKILNAPPIPEGSLINVSYITNPTTNPAEATPAPGTNTDLTNLLGNLPGTIPPGVVK